MEQQWEESEKILSWREMQPGVYRYHGIEHRGTNDYGRPISVITLEREGEEMCYHDEIHAILKFAAGCGF